MSSNEEKPPEMPKKEELSKPMKIFINIIAGIIVGIPVVAIMVVVLYLIFQVLIFVVPILLILFIGYTVVEMVNK